MSEPLHVMAFRDALTASDGVTGTINPIDPAMNRLMVSGQMILGFDPSAPQSIRKVGDDSAFAKIPATKKRFADASYNGSDTRMSCRGD